MLSLHLLQLCSSTFRCCLSILPAGTETLSSTCALVSEVQMYAQKFQLESHISFSTSVMKLWQTPGSCPNISLINIVHAMQVHTVIDLAWVLITVPVQVTRTKLVFASRTPSH